MHMTFSLRTPFVNAYDSHPVQENALLVDVIAKACIGLFTSDTSTESCRSTRMRSDTTPQAPLVSEEHHLKHRFDKVIGRILSILFSSRDISAVWLTPTLVSRLTGNVHAKLLKAAAESLDKTRLTSKNEIHSHRYIAPLFAF